MIFLSRFVAVLLAPLMVSLPLECQLPASAPAENGVSAAALQIRVVPPPQDAGALAKNALTVEVLDAAGSVVPQAAVVLRFPDAESSPVFPDGTHSAVLYTNDNGRASSREIRWSADAQSVSVRITAAKGDAHAGILYQAAGERMSQPALFPAASAPAKPLDKQSVSERPRFPMPPAAEAAHPHVMITTGKQPGVLPASEKTFSANEPAPEVDENTNIPIRHVISSDSSSQVDGHPGVSITHSGGALESSGGHSKMKWIAILALAGGAGAALAFVNKGKSSTSSSSSTNIGTPTVSLGHP